MLAGRSKTIEKFKKHLSKNEAEFPVSPTFEILFVFLCLMFT